jgi:hypothetical protein
MATAQGKAWSHTSPHMSKPECSLLLTCCDVYRLLLAYSRDTRSFILVVDSDAEMLSAAKAAAEADAVCAANVAAGHLVFELKADMTAMDDLEQVKHAIYIVLFCMIANAVFQLICNLYICKLQL